MKKFKYALNSNVIWASFDYGTVEAETIEEARLLAEKELKYNFDKVNSVLKSADVTINFTIEFDKNSIEVTEEK